MNKDWRIDLAALALRVGVGMVLMYFGLQKVFGLFGSQGYSASIHFMGKLGIHPLLANVSIITESLGSLLLVVGLLTRPAAIAVAGNMIVATFFNIKTTDSIAAFNSADEPLKRFQICLTIVMAMAALACAALGGGTYSLDGRFFKSSKKK